MNYHIVRTNEKIEKIISFYQLTFDEVARLNPQIKNWDKLMPGMKLRLPDISENLSSELDDIEPFIEDYYPKIDFSKIKETIKLNEEMTNEVETEPIIETFDEPHVTISSNEPDIKYNTVVPNNFQIPSGYPYQGYPMHPSYLHQSIMQHRQNRKRRK